jgi:hypothetical protein
MCPITNIRFLSYIEYIICGANMETPTETELVTDPHEDHHDSRLFREIWVNRVDAKPYTPSPALAMRYRHSNYNTLKDRCVEPAVKLALMMGLRVQGPIFLPSGGWWKGSDIMLNRIAIMLVSGSAETLVRYTKRASNLPRHGAKLDIRLEHRVEGKPFSPTILMRTTP